MPRVPDGYISQSTPGHARALPARCFLEPDGRRGHWLKIDEKLQQALALSEGDEPVVHEAGAVHRLDRGADRRAAAINVTDLQDKRARA
jgi:hypothetical protein